MPIPSLDPDYGYLPPGEHWCSLREIHDTYGHNYQRQALLYSFEDYLELRVPKDFSVEIFVGGSFVTSKPHPNDIDATMKFKSEEPNIYERLCAQKIIVNREPDKEQFKVDIHFGESSVQTLKNIRLEERIRFDHPPTAPKGLLRLQR